jgi:DNA-binding transcriptional LysR family regulator
MKHDVPMSEQHGIQDLNHIRVFAKVAELKGVTAAAKALGKPKSTISRDLARLESSIGTALFRRLNQRLSLTDTGALFYQHAFRILGDVEDAAIAVSQAAGLPRGLLRVSAPFTSGHALLAPIMPTFLQRYPDVQIALDLDNRRIDPRTDDVDVVIRVGHLEDSSLMARKLAHVAFGLFASSAYLARRSAPDDLAHLAEHDVIDKGGMPGARVWDLQGPNGPARVQVTPRLTVNDPSMVHAAIAGGVGIGWLPLFLAAQDVTAGRLVPVLKDFQRDSSDIHALFLSRRALSPKIRVFIDYLAECFTLPDRIDT